ncbi:MAG TPA: polysaccharide biosynthesis/export family protein [Phycisphaerae bacterium]|nr:polysaccharide biosynthesis/export family protein [Phycisphaerae bacterium]
MRRQRMPILAAGAAVLALAAGCYNPKEVEAFMARPRPQVSGTEYRILPPDVLLIKSRVIPEIDAVNQQVRPDGKINLPLVGELAVANKTPKEVERQISEIAREFYDYKDIDVNVQVVGYNSQKFYVFGRVYQPGPMAWTGHDTLLDALARAQIDFMAWPERIIIVRGSGPMEGGQADRQPSVKYLLEGVHPQRKDSPPKKITVNLWAMVQSGDMTNNILLEPNDVIYVQPNPCAKVGLAMQTLLLPIRPAVESIRAPAGAAGAITGGGG